MEVTTEWKAGVPVVVLKGRMDGFGAGVVSDSLAGVIRDDTISVVLDMGGVDYLSSAGIRVLLALKKRMKERKGIVALTGVGEFPRKVLDMSGFLQILTIYPSEKEALVACAKTEVSSGHLSEPGQIDAVISGARFSMTPGIAGTAELRVSGSLRKVLFSTLSTGDIRALGFRDCEYSIGLGALGRDSGEAIPFLGEMITLHGSIVYVPTDGHYTPDFFSPVKDTGDIKIYTGYNVALKGPFHEIIRVEAERGSGLTFSDLFGAVFSWARTRRPGSPGIISMAMWAVADGVISSEIIRSPLAPSAPKNGKSIMDPENHDEWFMTNTEPRYGGDTLVSFGIGIDPGGDLSSFSTDDLDAIVYRRPESPVQDGLHLHNHGVIFRNIPWNPSLELSRQIRAIVQDGEFVDMRHLMDGTRVRKAKCGISYISRITRD
jgi:anti-anti-sigma factor